MGVTVRVDVICLPIVCHSHWFCITFYFNSSAEQIYLHFHQFITALYYLNLIQQRFKDCIQLTWTTARRDSTWDLDGHFTDLARSKKWNKIWTCVIWYIYFGQPYQISLAFDSTLHRYWAKLMQIQCCWMRSAYIRFRHNKCIVWPLV